MKTWRPAGNSRFPCIPSDSHSCSLLSSISKLGQAFTQPAAPRAAPDLIPTWPLPVNTYVEGAVQCFPCPLCSSLQSNQIRMTQHFKRQHRVDSTFRDIDPSPYLDANSNWLVSSTFWCKQTGSGRRFQQCTPLNE